MLVAQGIVLCGYDASFTISVHQHCIQNTICFSVRSIFTIWSAKRLFALHIVNILRIWRASGSKCECEPPSRSFSRRLAYNPSEFLFGILCCRCLLSTVEYLH